MEARDRQQMGKPGVAHRRQRGRGDRGLDAGDIGDRHPRLIGIRQSRRYPAFDDRPEIGKAPHEPAHHGPARAVGRGGQAVDVAEGEADAPDPVEIKLAAEIEGARRYGP